MQRADHRAAAFLSAAAESSEGLDHWLALHPRAEQLEREGAEYLGPPAAILWDELREAERLQLGLRPAPADGAAQYFLRRSALERLAAQRPANRTERPFWSAVFALCAADFRALLSRLAGWRAGSGDASGSGGPSVGIGVLAALRELSPGARGADWRGAAALLATADAGIGWEVFEELGHVGNGHDWTRLIKNMLKKKSKSTLKKLEFSSEADCFVVYSNEKAALTIIVDLISKIFDDRELLKDAINEFGGH